jgi:hypothetical protein
MSPSDAKSGYDESLTEWTTSLLRDVKEEAVPIFENPLFYQHFDGNEGESFEIAKHWDQPMFAVQGDIPGIIEITEAEKQKGIKTSLDLIATRLNGSKFAPLGLDPGIASRLTKFIEFAKGYLSNQPSISAWSLREAFKAELDSRKNRRTVLYRAMALTEGEYEKIKTAGIYSYNSRVLPQTDQIKILHDQFANTLIKREVPSEDGAPKFSVIDEAQGPVQELRFHVLTGAHSNYISLSAHPKVAASVAMGSVDEDHKVYMFEINLPEISIIRSDDTFFPVISITGIKVDGTVYKSADDTEVFAANVIPAGAISKSYLWTEKVGEWEIVR